MQRDAWNTRKTHVCETKAVMAHSTHHLQVSWR
jgi:hypothetical protein